MRKGTFNQVKKGPARGIRKYTEEIRKSRLDVKNLRTELFEMADRALKEKLKTYTDTFDAMLEEHRATKALLAEKYGITQIDINRKIAEPKPSEIKK